MPIVTLGKGGLLIDPPSKPMPLCRLLLFSHLSGAMSQSSELSTQNSSRIIVDMKDVEYRYMLTFQVLDCFCRPVSLSSTPEKMRTMMSY